MNEHSEYVPCRWLDHDAIGDPPIVDPADHDRDCFWLKVQFSDVPSIEAAAILKRDLGVIRCGCGDYTFEFIALGSGWRFHTWYPNGEAAWVCRDCQINDTDGPTL
jgi:hypothetical protein